MDLNRETAMRLWNKAFGKETKVQDFAGRIISKGAYNDRNSDFGWNVDHILPKSRGGTTADYNLICCHIQTNDEKANKFPCFTSNDIAFEIIKVQNHYEIRRKDRVPQHKLRISNEIDFFDSASGVRFFKKLKGIQNKKRFVGTVFIRLRTVSNNAVIDFIEELFDKENISFSKNYSNEVHIKISNFNMPLKEDANALLDKCILLNTYFSAYFLECKYIGGFDIYYRMDCFEDKYKMYSAKFDVRDEAYKNINNSMFVNEIVLYNTDAGDDVECKSYSEYAEYNYTFSQLYKNLEKEANGK